jgi:hypothetical protein
MRLRPTPKTDEAWDIDDICPWGLARHFERELAEAMEQRDRLAEAARAVVDRWETPTWKDAPHTGLFIRALADALDAIEGGGR